jgi:hypothetical protein
MERVSVNSSNLVSMGYDPFTQTLEVEFRGGAVYRYFHVPPDVYSQMEASASKGHFLNSTIKPSYEYERV